MNNWRDLEQELKDLLRREGFELDEDNLGDIITVRGWDLNLTYLAKELWERMKK